MMSFCPFSGLAEMDTDVSRNFFGRQVNSFESPVKLKEKLLGPDDSTYNVIKLG
jgi:glutamine amidotransferase PdxT